MTESSNPTSDSIEAILERHGQARVTIDDCIDTLGDNSIVLGLLLFTLLSSLPLFSIPGFTTITGIPIILLGGQLLLGHSHLWLPNCIRRRELKSPRLWHWLERVLPYLQKAERHLKPRLPALSTPKLRRALGLVFVVMGILLALPIPFINFPAGFSMFLLALGMVERDGMVTAIGLGIIGLMFAAFAYMVMGAVALAESGGL